MDTRISTRELRKELADVINRAHYTDERFVVTRNGKPIAAVISFEELALLDRIEDLAGHDALDAAEAMDDGERTSIEDVRRELEREEEAA